MHCLSKIFKHWSYKFRCRLFPLGVQTFLRAFKELGDQPKRPFEIYAYLKRCPFIWWMHICRMLENRCSSIYTCTIEGLHDAVRTYTRMTLPHSLISFLYGAVWRKTTKPAVTFDLLYSKIWNFTRVCVLVLLSCGRNLVLWYELNKK